MYSQLTSEELRRIILGKTVYRKCPNCDENGIEYWDENGENVGPAPKEEWTDNYEQGECANCDGVGYVIAYEKD